MPWIVTLTLNPTVDKSAQVDRVIPDDELRCEDPIREPGGGGINVARVVERHGGDAHALYTSGGPMGTILERLLDHTGLSHTPLPVTDDTRENLILSEATSDRQSGWDARPRTHRDGPVPVLHRSSGSRPAPRLARGQWQPAPGLSADTYSRGTEAARAVGARDILDPSGAALRTAVDAGWYLLNPHLRELEPLSDAALKRDDDRIDAVRDCIARGWCEVMVVSMGASEALLVTADEAEHIRSPTVPVESRVGVGDGMVAGIPLALARGRAIETAA